MNFDLKNLLSFVKNKIIKKRKTIGGGNKMMYPFMTLNDNTEIVHSEMLSDGRVKVYIEKPDKQYGFKHALCYLPDYTWEDIYQFTPKEISGFQKLIESVAHLIMEFSKEGGFDCAANF